MRVRTCKTCSTQFEQHGPGRPRTLCDTHRRYEHRTGLRKKKEVIVRTAPKASRYDLPWHLLHQDGPKLVMPAPAHR